MLGVYFSGTGNTKHCVERFVSEINGVYNDNSGDNSSCRSIEDKDVITELSRHEIIAFGFPVYYSAVPKIVEDFIIENKSAFNGKKVYIIATKGLHNAFAIISARRMLEDCGAEYIGSSQFNMPDNIRDLKIMEIAFNYKKDGAALRKADAKIIKAAGRFKANNPRKSGLNPYSYIAGVFLKAAPFYPKTNEYITAPKVDVNKCNGCGKCAKLCPMQNVKVVDNKAVSGEKCAICYRCFSNCPTKAITILGNKVYGQYDIEKAKKQ